jgi:hypothetical protein
MIGMSTGYCVSPLALESHANVNCCLSLFYATNAENETPQKCLLHTAEHSSHSYSLLCHNIREVYDPVLTDFASHCSIDADCSDGSRCLKMLAPFGSQLLVLQTVSRKTPKTVYFEGPPSQLLSEIRVSSYRLRSWWYQLLDLGYLESLHGTLLQLRFNVKMHLRLLVQINLSTLLLNSLPVLYLDGGQALPHLLKALFPRYVRTVHSTCLLLTPSHKTCTVG